MGITFLTNIAAIDGSIFVFAGVSGTGRGRRLRVAADTSHGALGSGVSGGGRRTAIGEAVHGHQGPVEGGHVQAL